MEIVFFNNIVHPIVHRFLFPSCSQINGVPRSRQCISSFITILFCVFVFVLYTFRCIKDVLQKLLLIPRIVYIICKVQICVILVTIYCQSIYAVKYGPFVLLCCWPDRNLRVIPPLISAHFLRPQQIGTVHYPEQKTGHPEYD